MNRLASAAVALMLAMLFAAETAAQRGTNTGRVPPPSGWPRVGGFGMPSMGEIAPERRNTGMPFKGPIPFPPADGQWVRVLTPHFDIVSSAGERKTRAIAEDFERLTALLTRTSAVFRLPPNRTRVFVFGDHREVQPYIDAVRGVRVDATGITFRHPDGSTMLLDATMRGGEAVTPRHELVHDLLRRGERPLPLWIEEGLAEYYGNAGMTVREHVSRLRMRLRMPLAEMFAMGYDSPQSGSFDFYAQSWATVATLMRRDAQAFFALVADLDAGTSALDALRTHYRMSALDLEVAMRKVHAPATSVLLDPVSLQYAPKPVPHDELLHDLAELLARVPNREDEAERHFRAALDAAPDRDPLPFAEFLVTKTKHFEEARALAERQIENPRAQAVIALSYLGQNDRAAARPYLERAHIALPEPADIAFNLFALSIESGDRDMADTLFPRLEPTPRITDARRLLLRVDIPRADALAREGKLLEPARVLRDLAPKMPGKTRENLEMQAAGLEAAAKPR
ncbi:MAG TPA: hypothetical protein VHL59_13260 [Thermoanaerobaculia bacterium]|nr:hypothetical protein [Thermoanaerobaculia bacterium]